MQNVRTVVSAVVARYAAPNSKAIAGFVGAAALSLLVRLGVDPEVTVGEYVRVVVDGVVTASIVWAAPANSGKVVLPRWLTVVLSFVAKLRK